MTTSSISPARKGTSRNPQAAACWATIRETAPHSSVWTPRFASAASLPPQASGKPSSTCSPARPSCTVNRSARLDTSSTGETRPPHTVTAIHSCPIRQLPSATPVPFRCVLRKCMIVNSVQASGRVSLELGQAHECDCLGQQRRGRATHRDHPEGSGRQHLRSNPSGIRAPTIIGVSARCRRASARDADGQRGQPDRCHRGCRHPGGTLSRGDPRRDGRWYSSSHERPHATCGTSLWSRLTRTPTACQPAAPASSPALAPPRAFAMAIAHRGA